MGSSPAISEASKNKKRKPQRAPFERRVMRLCVALVAPALIVSGILIWLQPWSLESKLLLLGLEALVCLLVGAALLEHIVHPLQTLANVVGALRDEDYSFRARLAVPNDALGELSLEVNALADLLAQHRTGAIEAAALLQRVVEEVEIPIFAFDPQHRLRLVNSAGEKLLQQSSPQMLGKTAEHLHLKNALLCENETLVELQFGTHARWFVRRSRFRQRGVPHTLVVLSDVSRALREEERGAWQRLIRVLGHELNNSLTPIKSIAGTLRAQISRTGLEADQREDFERGLSIIGARADSLNRFLQAYRQLNQMPPPIVREIQLAPIVQRVAALEATLHVQVLPGPLVKLMADPDLLEQMLINLMRNAVEAALEPQRPDPAGGAAAIASMAAREPRVSVRWELTEKDLILIIEDNGPGLSNPSNVFVPFYTTKPAGSGIGLILSRQIAEAHEGSIELLNRTDQKGCQARVALPRFRALHDPETDRKDN
jgi:nitrogen fixation/metabolism regulation signal transduction histidine kinase